jgi:hypothetical protein
MATIQFLAGNPKQGKAKKSKSVKKAHKKAPSAAQLKARANFIKMVKAKSKAAKAAKKVSPKKAVKKVAHKKAHKKVMKKKVKSNPQYFKFQKGKESQDGVMFPTSAEMIRRKSSFKKLIDAKKKAPKKAQGEFVSKIKEVASDLARKKKEIQSGLLEKKMLQSKGWKKTDMVTVKDAEQEAYEAEAMKKSKRKDKAGKKKVAKMNEKKHVSRVKKEILDRQAILKAKQQKQGVLPVAKKKAKKKVSKRKSSKKVSKRKVAKKVSKKPMKKKARKSSKKKSRSFTLIGKGRIKSNPSIAGLTGQSDNMAVAGLAIGGFSYNLFNDLGKKYLPASVMNVVAMAGPVSGAVIPSAVAGLALFIAHKYPQNKALQKVSQVAKGILASAVVIASASAYQVIAQPMVKKAIGLAGDEELYGIGYDDMSGQSDAAFSGQSDAAFSGEADMAFSGDEEDEFGDDEF